MLQMEILYSESDVMVLLPFHITDANKQQIHTEYIDLKNDIFMMV